MTMRFGPATRCWSGSGCCDAVGRDGGVAGPGRGGAGHRRHVSEREVRDVLEDLPDRLSSSGVSTPISSAGGKEHSSRMALEDLEVPVEAGERTSGLDVQSGENGSLVHAFPTGRL